MDLSGDEARILPRRGWCGKKYVQTDQSVGNSALTAHHLNEAVAREASHALTGVTGKNVSPPCG